MVEIMTEPGMPTRFVDNLNIGIRADDMVLLRFLSHMPEGLHEEARLMTGKAHLKRFIESMCGVLDYYPKKPKVASSKRKSKK